MKKANLAPINIDSNQIKLPTSWSELTADQVKYIVKQKFTAPNLETFMTNSLIYLLGFKPLKGVRVGEGNLQFSFVKDKKRYLLDAITTLTLFEKIGFLTEPASPMECPQFEKLQSPNSRLYQITLKDFLYIDRLYCDFLATTDSQKLDPFFAKLFRGKNGFKKVEEIDKFVVVFWYTSIKSWLKEKYPYVFSESEFYEEEEFEQTPVEEYLITIIASLNEGRAADNEAIKNGEVHEMFFELNRKIEFSLKQQK